MARIQFVSNLLLIPSIIIMTIAWQNLPKNGTDNETIEEAIERIVTAHNDDPLSHTEDTQAIGQHRTDDIIDHPVGSVLGDKFTKKEFVITPNFENITLYNRSSHTFHNSLGGFRITGVTTNNAIHFLRASGQYSPQYYRNDKELTFQFTAAHSGTTNNRVYLVAGLEPPNAVGPSVGWKIENNQLYAMVASNNEYGDVVENLQVITGLSGTPKRTYRVHQIPDEGIVNFYIDGEKVAELPLGNQDDVDLMLFTFWYRNLQTGQRNLSVSGIYYSIEI